MAKSSKGGGFTDILNMYSASREEEFIPTGVDCLNDLFGGGISPRAMYGVWGPQGCGKSTLCFQIIKAFCNAGHKAMFIDVEKAFNENQQKAFGLYEHIQSGNLYHIVVSNYEDFEKVIEAVPDTDIKLVVVDSETMIRPSVGKDLKVTDVRPGLKANQSAFILNKMKDLFYNAGIASILLFHARANISMTGGTVPETKQAGGFAAYHIPDVILKVTAGAKVKEGDEIIGQIVRLMTEKNKFAKPFTTVEKKLIYGKGISKRIDLIDTALERGVITMAGAGFYTIVPTGEKVRGTKALYDLPSETLSKIKEYMQ